MEPWIWIVIALVAVVVVVFVVGLVLSRRRRVSIAPAEKAGPAVEADKPVHPKGGGYTSGSSISFSSGTGGGAVARHDRRPGASAKAEPEAGADLAHPVADRTETDGQPGVGDDASVPRDSERDTVVDVELPGDEVVPDPVSDDPVVVVPVADEPVGAESTADEPSADGPAADAATEAAVAADQVARGVEAALSKDTTEVAAAATADTEMVGPGQLDEIDPTTGRLARLRGRLSRSQNVFGRSLLGLLGAGDLDEDSWQDVEDTLLMADLGAGAAADLTERLRAEVAARGVADTASARALLREVLVDAVDAGITDRSVRALPHDGRPAVVLVVGVNGTGKTTTTGKLARVLVADGRTVVLGAADTFRAAAADQLQTWGERAGAVVVRSYTDGADPAAVAFDAVKRGIEDGVDTVLIDTAGRLHTKTGLMDELGKVKRVVSKQAEVDEVLLVLDATTGQNGLVQARVFADVVDITGIVLTKLDGTAKGGIVVAVQRALGVPVKLVGLGEGPDDLAPFEAGAFVDALLGS